MRANQKIKTTPIKWKALKIKTTKKMEKKNRFNPKIEDSLSLKIYLNCHNNFCLDYHSKNDIRLVMMSGSTSKRVF